jgi:hypothetical protein
LIRSDLAHLGESLVGGVEADFEAVDFAEPAAVVGFAQAVVEVDDDVEPGRLARVLDRGGVVKLFGSVPNVGQDNGGASEPPSVFQLSREEDPRRRPLTVVRMTIPLRCGRIGLTGVRGVGGTG